MFLFLASLFARLETTAPTDLSSVLQWLKLVQGAATMQQPLLGPQPRPLALLLFLTGACLHQPWGYMAAC